MTPEEELSRLRATIIAMSERIKQLEQEVEYLTDGQRRERAKVERVPSVREEDFFDR